MPDLSTPEATRAFLRLCLNPPGRSPRTPRKLVQVMPDWLRTALHEHAPHLAALNEAADRWEAEAEKARAVHVAEVKRWIEQDNTAAGESGSAS